MWSTRSRLAALLLAAPLAAGAQAWTGPVFDAHLHYNDDAQAPYSVGSAFELFRKNGVKAILANSRPNDGTRALYEAWRKNPSLGVEVVPFIRVYRNRADYGTWQDNREIHAMIVEEEKRGYYRGVGEFHVHGRAADTPVLKDIVDFAVARGLVLHARRNTRRCGVSSPTARASPTPRPCRRNGRRSSPATRPASCWARTRG